MFLVIFTRAKVLKIETAQKVPECAEASGSGAETTGEDQPQ